MRRFFVYIIVWYLSFGLAFADDILPAGYKLPGVPLPGNHGCTSCGSGDSEGNEIPHVNSMSVVMMKINLLEELDTIDFGQGLLTITPGSNVAFAPESRYILQSPNEQQDYVRVLLNEVPLRFRAKFDEIGQSNFYSYTRPGYSLGRDGNNLIVTNHNDQIEYRFASFDGGVNWKIDTIRKQHSPARQIQCRYNNDGLITEIILPGERKYLLEYKFGQVVKVTSPAGAVTNIEWNESGSLKRINTTLLPEHPLYAENVKKDRRGKEEPAIVRDLHFTCTPQGVLQEIVNSSGERYAIRSATTNKGKTGERLTIIIYPDGTRKFQKSVTAPGTRQIEEGVILNKDKKEEFITVKTNEYILKDGVWISKGAVGSKYEYRAPFNTATSVTDAYGNRTTFAYNSCGLKTSVIYPGKAKKTLEYDIRWNKTKKVDECGRTKIWTYDDHNRLLQYQYGDLITKYEYDDQGRPVKSITPGNLNHLFEWDANSRLISYTRPNGVATEYQYHGSLDKVKALNIVANDKSEKYTRTYDYDLQGRLKRINYPDKTYEGFAYDCCNLIAQKDRHSNVFSYTYDQSHRLIRATFNNKIIFNASYDKYGRLVEKTNAKDGREKREYAKTWDNGKAWYANSIIDSNGHNKIFTRNAEGWPVRITDANGKEALYRYNYAHKPTVIRGNLEPWRDFVYDKSGNLIEEAYYGLPLEDNPSLSRKIKYKFDNSNRKIMTLLPDGSVNETVYQKGSDWIYYIRNGDKLTFFTYNAEGQVVSHSFASYKEFNASGSITDKQDLIQAKIMVQLKYDVLGRLWIKSDVRGRPITIYIYEGATDKTASIIEAVSDEYGAVFSCRNKNKIFVKYSKLEDYM